MKNTTIMNMAEKALDNKRGKSALFVIIIGIISLILELAPNIISGFEENPSIVQSLAILIFSCVSIILLFFLGIGHCSFFYCIFKQNKASFKELFAGFRNFKRNLLTIIIISLLYLAIVIMTIAIVALINALFTRYADSSIYKVSFVFCLSAVLFYLGYKLMPVFIAVSFRMGENETEDPWEIIKVTYKKVSPHCLQYLTLYLRFIGWFIASVFTLGILLLWVWPYLTTSLAILYESIFYPDSDDLLKSHSVEIDIADTEPVTNQAEAPKI